LELTFIITLPIELGRDRSILMFDLSEIVKTINSPIKKVNNTKWSFILEFIVFIEENDLEIYSTNILTLSGTIDSDCYFGEVAENMDTSDILADIQGIVGEIDGFYRITYGVGYNGWTDYWGESDYDLELDILTVYLFDERESILLSNPDTEVQMVELDCN
jgi:hypothetical protein